MKTQAMSRPLRNPLIDLEDERPGTRTKYCPHYNEGKSPTNRTAFVLSVPGQKEEQKSWPVAGFTGKNLSRALETLHANLPKIFPSRLRYDYRITNSFHDPIYRAISNGKSETSDAEVAGGAARVIVELRGCTLVVLCGKKARLLADRIQQALPRALVIETCHISSFGLNALGLRSRELIEKEGLSDPQERNCRRVQAWAGYVERKILDENRGQS